MHDVGQTFVPGRIRVVAIVQEEKCKIVQSPSKTTHILQPCDQDVNRSFKKSVPKYRDLLHKHTTFDIRSVRANPMVAALACSNITVDSIKSSFKKTGLWPMNYSFLDWFIGEGRGSLQIGTRAGKEVGENVANRTRNSDSHTFGCLQKTLSAAKDPIPSIRDAEILLSNTRVSKTF